MKAQGQPSRAAYPGYDRFFAIERNGYPQDPGAQWRIMATQAGEPTPSYAKPQTNLTQAVAEVKARLQARRESLLAQAEGCAQQLAQLDELYRPRPTPGQAFAAQRDRVLLELRRWKQDASPRFVEFEGFNIDFGFMELPNLMVISLPEYDAINAHFLTADVELILAMVSEAGICHAEHWNGEGCYSMSVRAPLSNFDSTRAKDAVASTAC